METEEGRSVRVGITLANPSVTQLGEVRLAAPAPYDPKTIARLAMATSATGDLLVVRTKDGFQIRGFGDGRFGSPIDTLSIELVDPGILRLNTGLFQPYALINRGVTKIIAATRSDLAAYLQKHLGKSLPSEDVLETQAVWRECGALALLARMIVAKGHGGTG